MKRIYWEEIPQEPSPHFTIQPRCFVARQGEPVYGEGGIVGYTVYCPRREHAPVRTWNACEPSRDSRP